MRKAVYQIMKKSYQEKLEYNQEWLSRILKVASAEIMYGILLTI